MVNKTDAGSSCVLFFLSLFLSTVSFSAQIKSVSTPHVASDVVMLSLQPLNPRAEHGRHVREGLVGNSDPELSVEKICLISR
jgi:hypothetical protein